jgi:mRNA-degrading endonuclease RelE of RelBE toxin-antitoxin system
MVKFIFNKDSKRKFFDLEPAIQERVRQKLIFLKNHPNIYSVLVKVESIKNVTHRLRIGNIRLLLNQISFRKTDVEFFVVDIGHRREIYR